MIHFCSSFCIVHFLMVSMTLHRYHLSKNENFDFIQIQKYNSIILYVRLALNEHYSLPDFSHLPTPLSQPSSWSTHFKPSLQLFCFRTHKSFSPFPVTQHPIFVAPETQSLESQIALLQLSQGLLAVPLKHCVPWRLREPYGFCCLLSIE